MSATYDVFLSHSYGPANAHHNQVAQIARELRALQSPKTPWLDETNLPYAADLEHTFETAIESSRCFFLFLTQEYQDKVFDQRRAFNWCRYEHRLAIRMNKPVLVILLDPTLRDPQTSWCRSMQVHHDDRLYFDMSDPTIFTNPQLLREKCILLGRILDELQNRGDMAAAINTILPNNDYCPIHNEHYEYYDTVADQVICRHCAATTHEGHAKVTIVEKARQIREHDLSTTQQRLTNIINDYNRTATRLMEIRDDDLETRDIYQREIHEVFQQMRDEITETENRMIAIVQTKHNHQQRTIDQLHTKTLERQQQSQALLNHLNHPATNVSFVMRWIEANRARPENIDIPDPFTMLLLPNVVSSSKFEFRLLQNKFQDWCSIISQSIEVPYCVRTSPPVIRSNVNPTWESYSYYFIFRRPIFWNSFDIVGESINSVISLTIRENTISVCHGNNRIATSLGNLDQIFCRDGHAHVCWTVQSGIMTIYLNGRQISQTLGIFHPICEPISWRFSSINISIHRLLWWNRALTSNEVWTVIEMPYILQL